MYTVGVIPAAAYGAEVHGVNITEELNMARAVSFTGGCKARRKSLEITNLLLGVPHWRALVAQL